MGGFCKQTVKNVNLRDRTVLVRTDYNVPLKKDGTISDDLRIRASLPTLKYLLQQNCKIVIISHLGRPSGRDSSLSLRVVAKKLSQLLEQKVRFVDDCVGEKVRRVVKNSSLGEVILLENLRFYHEEESDDLQFAKAIQRAVRADYFVQDGFGVVHRSHASTHAITLYVPSVAGLLIEKEYTTITEVMVRAKRPVVAIVGGAKVSDKITLIKRLIDISDTILIGGAMANTFLKSRGIETGSSLTESGQDKIINEVYATAVKKVGQDQVDNFLRLPIDVAVSSGSNRDRVEANIDKISSDMRILDIGSQTIQDFSAVIKKARTVIWNGPMGYYEDEKFAIGSARIAMAIAQNTAVISIVGGGDTADFALKWDGHDGANFTHVSTGGGASMELMSGKKLPGIESLLDAYGMRC